MFEPATVLIKTVRPVWPLGQVALPFKQTRFDVAVGAVSSYCWLLQTVRLAHSRSSAMER